MAAWNAATSVPDVVRRLKEIAGGAAPKWVVMARAVALRKGGVELKSLPATETVWVENGAARQEPRG